MNALSWILVGMIALWFAFAVAHIVRHRGECGCGHASQGCDGCARCGSCAKCRQEK